MEQSGFDFADVVEDAVQRSGGETATAEDILKVRRGVRLILERWAAMRYNTWRLSTLSVLAAGPEVRLTDKIDDIITVTSALGSGGTESPMTRIGPEQYFKLTTKDTPGTPSQWYLSRENDSPKLFIYPIGASGQTTTLNIYAVTRPAAFDSYDNGLDAPSRWLEAMVLGCALQLAQKRPINIEGVATTYDEPLIARLTSEYLQALDVASNADRQRTTYRLRGRAR